MLSTTDNQQAPPAPAPQRSQPYEWWWPVKKLSMNDEKKKIHTFGHSLFNLFILPLEKHLRVQNCSIKKLPSNAGDEKVSLPHLMQLSWQQLILRYRRERESLAVLGEQAQWNNRMGSIYTGWGGLGALALTTRALLIWGANESGKNGDVLLHVRALDGRLHLAEQVADLAELCQGSHRGDLPFASQDVVREVLHGAWLCAVLLERWFDHLYTWQPT